MSLHVARLTDGTTTLVDLAGGPIFTQSYVPRSPDISETEFIAEMEDGGEIMQATRRNVSEQADLVITGDTTDDVRQLVQDIEAVLRLAEEFQNRKVGQRIYFEFQPGKAGDIYRAEILTGRVELGMETTRLGWMEKAFEASLIFKRRFYFEGPETELPLLNGSVEEPTTGGVTVYNHQDSHEGHDNYVQIAGTDVPGVLPSPIRLSIYNSYDVAAKALNVYVAHNAFSHPETLTYTLEGEDAYAPDGSDVEDVFSSEGEYKSVPWTGDDEKFLMSWELTGEILDACAGNLFRLWCRFGTQPVAGIKVKAKLLAPAYAPNDVTHEAQEVILSANILQTLGVLRLPPWLVGQTGIGAISLALYAQKTGGGTLNVDFFQLLAMDGYRVYTALNTIIAFPFSCYLKDDGIANQLWLEWLAVKFGHYSGTGFPLHVWPGRTNRLYFLADNTSGGSEISQTFSVKVYYRPRRLTL